MKNLREFSLKSY